MTEFRSIEVSHTCEIYCLCSSIVSTNRTKHSITFIRKKPIPIHHPTVIVFVPDGKTTFNSIIVLSAP